MRRVLLMMVGLSLSLTACGKGGPVKADPNTMEEKTAQAAGAAVDEAKQEKNEYVAKAQRDLDAAKKEIDELRAKAQTAGAKVRAKLEQEIKMLEAKWKVAGQKLDELKSSSADAWKDLKSGVDQAVEDLTQSSEKAKKESK